MLKMECTAMLSGRSDAFKDMSQNRICTFAGAAGLHPRYIPSAMKEAQTIERILDPVRAVATTCSASLHFLSLLLSSSQFQES